MSYRDRQSGQSHHPSGGDARSAANAACPGKSTLTMQLAADPAGVAPPIQRACATCGGTVGGDHPCPQCAGASDATPASAAPAAALGARSLVPGGGRALAPAERAPFERAFRADFAGVRVHDGGAADASARSVDALAF